MIMKASAPGSPSESGGARSAISGYWSFDIDIHERKTDSEWSTTCRGVD